jgi:hypothetical protein
MATNFFTDQDMTQDDLLNIVGGTSQSPAQDQQNVSPPDIQQDQPTIWPRISFWGLQPS